MDGVRIFNIGSCGWADFKFNNNVFPISYLTDAPLDILEEILEYINGKYRLVVVFDAEGYSWTLVLNEYRVYMISEKNNCELIQIDMTPNDFIKQIVNDIKTQMEYVYNWMESEEEVEDFGELQEHLDRKDKINELLKQIDKKIGELKW